MSIGLAMAAAPPRHLPQARNALPNSPLNPLSACRHPTSATAVHISNVETAAPPTTTLSTAAHLANLERLLEKQKQEFPDPPVPGLVKIDHDGEHNAPSSSRSSRLLQALNLTSAIFPSGRFSNKPAGAEEMSPRSLTRLRRLLSNSNRASPRGSIAGGWRRFHGAGDWEGLLDPLNDDLRRELVRHGEFVQATYHAFHSTSAPPGRPRHVLLPDRSYRVTRNLFATASIELPPWVDTVAPWVMAAHPTSWIGYVAVCENEREIRRMGRRDIVIALRGTSTCLEWAENFRTELVPLDEEEAETDEQGLPTSVPKVECGFRSLYKTPGLGDTPSLSAAVVEEVKKLRKEYSGEELSITVLGHSLGAALAVLVADEVAALVPPEQAATAVFTFGGPRVGNRAFAERVEKRGVKVLRVVNAHDLVPRVPAAPLRTRDEGYAHVGRELVVDSRSSPYLRPDADPACCHDLEAYLHLVDGFTAVGRPFREDAKRSLARLLSQQGANIKKLYLNQAQELRLKQAAESFGRCNSGQLASPSSTF
ncbi:phospholipase A1-Ibeta2, chloroplastic-like [Curcuma longa]|uniref:phospholipase A1-Ibeta2, chloroplastic-like n=1 Tax=Curcuma longa TaxID=136217 RepID=UPI003D9F7FC6